MPTPILTIGEMRSWEADSWNAGRVESEVVATVGKRLAQRLGPRIQPGQSVLILAGKGNNGADAKALASELPPSAATLLSITDPARDLPTLEKALASRPDWIVDGLFGIGLNRPLDSAWITLVGKINQSGVPVLAIDLPSGLNADTGHAWGAAIRADWTLAVGAPKIGLLQSHAIEQVGRLEVLRNVGLIPPPRGNLLLWIDEADNRPLPPRRPVSSHKGSLGHLAILAGAPGCHGAAVLAARGAARARPGLISVHCDDPVWLPVAAHLQAQMVHPGPPSPESLARNTAILVGPGLLAPANPAAWRDLVRSLWQTSPVPLVVDASALHWLEAGPIQSTALRVVTPHPGEAARLLDCGAATVQKDRLAAARELSRRYAACVVVLKGHQTIVAPPRGPLSVNGSGNPALAQGGSGDILAGLLSGFLAQPELARDPIPAIRHAVWRHGHAADLLEASGQNWTIDQLPLQL